MPLYKFHCKEKNCGHHFSQFLSINHTENPSCPKCGSRNVVKIISGTTFKLTGTGWYQTDYAEKKNTMPPISSETHQKTSEQTSTNKTSSKSESTDSSKTTHAASS